MVSSLADTKCYLEKSLSVGFVTALESQETSPKPQKSSDLHPAEMGHTFMLARTDGHILQLKHHSASAKTFYMGITV